MSQPHANASWDAGEMGCGELVVKLKLKFRNELQLGDVLELTATDAGAPEDNPAWCRLTRNPLLFQQHPKYYIQVKESH